MKLRSQIFLFLFLFGLVPLFAALVINVPLVFERIESLVDGTVVDLEGVDAVMG